MIDQFSFPLVKYLWDAGQYLLAAFVLIVILRLGWYWGLRNPNAFPESRKEAKQAICEERWGQRYVNALKWLNQKLAGWIGDVKKVPRQYLTLESYKFCLKLAFLYPVLAFFAAWILGGNGRLGELPVLDAEMPDWQRGLSFTALLVAIGLAVWSTRLPGWKPWVTGAIAFIGVGAVAFLGIDTGTPASAFIIIGALYWCCRFCLFC